MRIWHFSEQSYYPAWPELTGDLRVDPPSRLIDPAVTHQLLNRYIDEWMLADDLGFDIMVNEHHASLTCLSTSVTMTLAMLARQTKKARLLALGIPLANRPDPLRVAEEITYIDTMSGGRLEVGFVKGSAPEPFVANENPVRMMNRFWEAHDFIIKALTTTDGPFRWEGEYFQYRSVNIYPRTFQEPHPPIWIPTTSARSARGIADKGYVCASLGNGYGAKDTFAAYREQYAKTHGRAASTDRLGYLCYICVGHDREQAEQRARQLNQFRLQIPRTPPGMGQLPGYVAAADAARLAKMGISRRQAVGELGPDGKPIELDAPLDVLAASGVVFWGTPDMVFEQIRSFSQAVGGIGHLLAMMQGGPLSHEDTADSITLLSKEVYPRLKEWAASQQGA